MFDELRHGIRIGNQKTSQLESRGLGGLLCESVYV